MPAVTLLTVQQLAANAATELSINQRRLNANLQTAATTAVNGTTPTLAGEVVTTLSFEGTATAFTVIVEGSVDGTNYWALEVVKRGSLDLTQSVTAKGIYVVDLSGLNKVRARIASISGGNLTVLAR